MRFCVLFAVRPGMLIKKSKTSSKHMLVRAACHPTPNDTRYRSHQPPNARQPRSLRPEWAAQATRRELTSMASAATGICEATGQDKRSRQQPRSERARINIEFATSSARTQRQMRPAITNGAPNTSFGAWACQRGRNTHNRSAGTKTVIQEVLAQSLQRASPFRRQ